MVSLCAFHITLKKKKKRKHQTDIFSDPNLIWTLSPHVCVR